MTPWIRCVALVLCLGAGAHAQEGAPTMDEQLEALLAEDLEASMRAWPEWASARGDRRFDDRLADHRPEAYAARLADSEARLVRLRALDREALSEANRINAGLLEHVLSERLEEAPFDTWREPVSQLEGPQQSLPQLPDRLSFTTPQHLADYVCRLEAVPDLIAQTMANMQAGLEAGWTPPQVCMAGAADQALAQAKPEHVADPTTHALYEPFEEHPADDPLATRAREAIARGVIPAFAKLGVYLRDVYTPGCRESIAASALPNGVAYYAQRLRSFSTTDLSADAIHQLGLDEVARIRSEMLAVIARSDYGNPDGLAGDALLTAFLAYLRTDPRFYHTSAEALLSGYRDIAKRVDAELPALFGRLPRLPYGVREMPESIAKAAPTAYYYRGSARNGVAGFFIANTYRLDQRPRYAMVPLTLHEAVPGHHLQIAIQQELEEEGLPEWRTTVSFTAYVEGWALYAERLGLEMGEGPHGIYADPYDDFGRLTYEMWRALRLVVDPGIHAKGWSRQQAIDYMLANSALSRTNVEREVDRYIAWPGQAVAYKIGELRIRALRAEAEEALGERFDIRAFHDAVLLQGPLPLQVLEAHVRRWIASQG